jgi:hypothetical protein
LCLVLRVQLQLSWVKWLLPERLFRHGFDFRQQQRQQHFLQRRQQQQGRRETDDTEEQLQQPLLLQGQSDGAPEPANAPNSAPFGSSSDAAGAGDPSSVVVEVTAAGASGSSSSSTRSRSSSRRRGGRIAHSRSGSSIGGDGVGPPVVKDVWQEAVELLMSNGGDAKVSWRNYVPICLAVHPICAGI